MFLLWFIMAEPDRILIWSEWPIYSHNFIISNYPAMIFSTYWQEAFIYIPIEFLLTFLVCLLSCSSFYNE